MSVWNWRFCINYTRKRDELTSFKKVYYFEVNFLNKNYYQKIQSTFAAI